MKKLMSQEEIEKKQKRLTSISSIVLLLILVISTIGFAFISNPFISNEKEIPEKKVYENNGFWSFKFGNQEISLISSPESLSDIQLNFSLTLNDYYNQPLYIDSSDELITREIGSSLGLYTTRAQEACFGECERNLPEKNCSSNLIIFKDKNQSLVYQQDKCIFIEGDIKSTDAFLYRLFGI